MNVPYPRGPLLHALTVLSFLLCQLLPSLSSAAQGGASESISTRPSSGHIVVYVRDASGGPLTMSASVRLYSAEGTPLGQASTGTAGQVTFVNVHPGTYTVEVEAAGYVKAHADARLPLVGEAEVEIELRPETYTSAPVGPARATVILAPNAKKELDAGLEAMRAKNLKDAEHHLENAALLAPSHPDVLYFLGTLYAQLNALQRAEEVLEKAMQLDPQHGPTQAALGIVFVNQGKFEAAVPLLERALELDAQSWEARWALARCYYHRRSFQSALDQSRQALHDSKGRAPEITLVVAASLTATGRYEESAALLREFIRQYPDRPETARARRWVNRLKQAGKIKQD